MVSIVLINAGIEGVPWIVKRVLVMVSPWVLNYIIVSCEGEEEPVPGRLLLVLLIFLVPVALIVSLKSSLLSYVRAIIGYHCWECA
jgi:hypothetical protein